MLAPTIPELSHARARVCWLAEDRLAALKRAAYWQQMSDGASIPPDWEALEARRVASPLASYVQDMLEGARQKRSPSKKAPRGAFARRHALNAKVEATPEVRAMSATPRWPPPRACDGRQPPPLVC